MAIFGSEMRTLALLTNGQSESRISVSLSGGKLRVICQLESLEEPSNHAGQIQSGIFANGCVRAVPGAVAAVDEAVDAARGPGQQSDNGTEAIAPGYAAVAFANKGEVMKMFVQRNSKRNKTFPLKLLPWSPSTRLASIGRTFGA